MIEKKDESEQFSQASETAELRWYRSRDPRRTRKRPTILRDKNAI